MAYDSNTLAVYTLNNTLADATGQHGNLTAVGTPSFVTDKVNKGTYSYRVPNTSNYVRFPADIVTTLGSKSAWTISGWFCTTVLTDRNWVPFFEARRHAVFPEDYLPAMIGLTGFQNRNYDQKIGITLGVGGQQRTSETQLTGTTNFQRFNLEWTGTAIKVYIDGVLIHTYNTTVNIFDGMSAANLPFIGIDGYFFNFLASARYDYYVVSDIARDGADVEPLPDVTSCTPDSGSTAGGTGVTIAGANFTGATGVTFGGDAATSVSVVSDTEITCVTPAHAAGAVDIVVTTSAGIGTLTNGFTYINPAPTVTSITPVSGPTVGGQTAILTGSNLTDVTKIEFDSAEVTSFTIDNDNQITLVTPPHSAGIVDITAYNANGSNTLANAYTYIAGDMIKRSAFNNSKFEFKLKRRRKNLGLYNWGKTWSAAIDRAWSVYVTDTAIYVSVKNSAATYHIYKYDLNGENRTSVHNRVNEMTALAVMNDYVFFYKRGSNLYMWNTLNSTETALIAITTLGGTSEINYKGQLYSNIGGSVVIYDFGLYKAKTTKAGKTLVSVCADANGNFYFSNYTDNLIEKYSPAHAAVTTWSVTAPTGCVVQGTKIYVMSQNGAVYDLMSYNLDGTGGARLAAGVSGGGYAGYITADADYIYVRGTNTIKAYTLAGALAYEIAVSYLTATLKNLDDYIYYVRSSIDNQKYVMRVNKDGRHAPEQLFALGGTGIFHLGIDPSGFIYISDFNNDKMLKYTQSGELCVEFATTGSGDGQVDGPGEMIFSRYGNSFFVVDVNNARIQEFSYGKLIDNFADTGFITFNNDKNKFYTNPVVGGVNVIREFTGVKTLVKTYSDFNYSGRITYVDSERAIYATVQFTQKALKYYDNFSKRNNFTYRGAEGVSQFPALYHKDNFLYMASTIGLFRYEITPDYDSEFIDITQDVIDADLQLSNTSEESNFSLGKITTGDVSIALKNNADKYDFESNPQSLFYSPDSTYQRNRSLLRIEYNGLPIAQYIIDGKNITSRENKISFKGYTAFKYLENINSDEIKSALAGTEKVSKILELIINNRFCEYLIAYDASQIDLTYDPVVDAPAELPDNLLDIIAEMGKIAGVQFGLDKGTIFYTNNFIDSIAAKTADRIILPSEILGVEAYNNGEHRLFKNVNVNYGNNEVKTFTIGENVQLMFEEGREVDFDIKSIASGTVAQNVADLFEYIAPFPTKEIELKLPFFNYPNANPFKWIYAINLFGNSRGIKVNQPSLPLDNTTIADKASAIDNKRRVLYYVLGIKHKIGKSNYTILKLKEGITDK